MARPDCSSDQRGLPALGSPALFRAAVLQSDHMRGYGEIGLRGDSGQMRDLGEELNWHYRRRADDDEITALDAPAEDAFVRSAFSLEAILFGKWRD